MSMLSTPFDGEALPVAVPGHWSASTSAPPIPSLPSVGMSTSSDGASLVTPWDGVSLAPSDFPAVDELPTL